MNANMKYMSYTNNHTTCMFFVSPNFTNYYKLSLLIKKGQKYMYPSFIPLWMCSVTYMPHKFLACDMAYVSWHIRCYGKVDHCVSITL